MNSWAKFQGEIQHTLRQEEIKHRIECMVYRSLSDCEESFL